MDFDLCKELDKYIEGDNAFIKDNFVVEKYNGDSFNHIYDLEGVAKHFFELGLRSTITEEDCKLIWNIGNEIPQNMSEEDFFKELLKRFKV